MNTDQMYACAYKEVLIILSLLSEEDWNKIPKSRKDFYFDNMDKDYKFEIDLSKNNKQIKLLKTTEAILANIYKEYLADENEKRDIEIREKEEFDEIEEEKRKKYNPDDIFKKIDNNNLENELNRNLPAEVKKLKFYEKIFNFIKKFLNNK